MATWKEDEGNRAACSLMTWKRKRNCADWSTVPIRRCSVADQIGPWLLYLLCCFHRGLRRRGAFVIRKPYRHVEVISRQTGLSLLPSPPFCPAAQEMLEGNWEEEKERQRGKHREKGESKLRFNACLPSESFSSLINGSGPRPECTTDGISDRKHVGPVFVFPCVCVERLIWLMSVLTELWIYTDV